MKKNKFLAKLLLPFLAVIIAACTRGSGGSDSLGNSNGGSDGKTRIALLINGNLGDMSFFDSAAAGMRQFKEDYPDVIVDIVEMGTDNTKWEPTLRLTANDNYNLIIVGTNDMREPLQRLTRNSRYNDKRFILFDAEIEDDKASNYPSVHSVLFKQNEGGYLAGALAALMTLDANKTKTGFIGGMKIDIINDFGYGFMQGVNKVNEMLDKNVLAYNSYIGDFFNSPKGKTLADTMFNEGDVDVLFAAASQAGLGTFDSAKNNNKYVIGVDSDQYDYFEKVDLAKAKRIVTSVLKRVDLTLYELSEQFINNELTYGVLQYEGLKEGKIGIVQNENYETIVSELNQTIINDLIAEIISGEIVVESGLRRFTSTADLNAYYDALDPNKQ